MSEKLKPKLSMYDDPIMLLRRIVRYRNQLDVKTCSPTQMPLYRVMEQAYDYLKRKNLLSGNPLRIGEDDER